MGISQHCCAIRANPAKGTQTDKSSSSPEKTDKSNRVYEDSRHFQPLVRVLVNLVTLCRGLSWVLAQLPVQYCDKPPLRLTSGSVCTTWLPKYTHTQETVNHLTLKSAPNTQNCIILLWNLFLLKILQCSKPYILFAEPAITVAGSQITIDSYSCTQ